MVDKSGNQFVAQKTDEALQRRHLRECFESNDETLKLGDDACH